MVAGADRTAGLYCGRPILDPHGQPVFPARAAALNLEAVRGLGGVAVYAGMPADVPIIVGERSVLDLLTSPIRENLRQGTHEE